MAAVIESKGRRVLRRLAGAKRIDESLALAVGRDLPPGPWSRGTYPQPLAPTPVEPGGTANALRVRRAPRPSRSAGRRSTQRM